MFKYLLLFSVLKQCGKYFVETYFNWSGHITMGLGNYSFTNIANNSLRNFQPVIYADEGRLKFKEVGSFIKE